jgi:hypothetical protein
MSRALLAEAITPLPYSLRDHVFGYATFVQEVVSSRAADMGFDLTHEQRDQVVFLSGVFYVRDLVAGQLALAEAATGKGQSAAAGAGVRGIRIGGDDLTRSSPYIKRLRTLRNDLNKLLSESNVPPTATRLSDAIELVAAAADER